MSFRNRCTISGANGVIHLSVPLVGGRNQKRQMLEVRIDNKKNWQANHWKSITSCYNKSPWFDHYRNELQRIYEHKYDSLMEWDLVCNQWICDKMSIKTPLELSTSYIKKYDEANFSDWRSRLRPSTIHSTYPQVTRYPQVFEERVGFIPNLSILDKLFCDGNKL